MRGEIINRVPLGKTNSYLITIDKGLILIDAGVEGKVDGLKKSLIDLGADWSDIQLIIITHVHYDHVGNLAEIKEKSQAPVLVHQAGADKLAQGQSDFPCGTIWFSKIISKLANIFLTGDFKAIKPDIIINDNYDLNDFGIAGEIIFTPGHTVDSLSIILDNGSCIVGDTLFNFFPNTVYPPFADDEQELINSWQKLKRCGCEDFYPGHGSKFSKEKFDNSFKELI